MKEKTVSAVDIIVERENKVLMLVRNKEPFEGRLVIPGGGVKFGERVEDAAVREMEEETGLKVKPKEILGVYSDIERDTRWHSVSTCFVCDIVSGKERISREAKEIKWIDLNELDTKEIGFDHKKMLKDYIRWKENRGTYWSSKGP